MKQKRKISFAICGATLVVITALIIVILPVIFFIHDFEEAVKTKNTQHIEKYITSPMSLVSDDDYVFIDTGEKSGNLPIQYSLFALDSEYSLKIIAFNIESISKVHFVFEANRLYPDGSSTLLFYNVIIERNLRSCVITSFDNDI